jgi:protoporphyrinogen IX oxidase
MPTLLLVLHVMANLVWIGSIACVGWLSAAAAKEPDPARAQTVAQLAANLYQRVATPAFGASFAFGVARLACSPEYYMKSHWFHGKLTAALAVIAIHHVIGAKAKRASSGSVQAGASSAILTGALLVSAFAAVVFVTYKTDLIP